MNILFAGAESAGLHTLRMLADSEHTLKGVLSDPQSTNTRMGPGVAEAARKLGYTVKPAKLIEDPNFAEWIVENDIDVLLNVHSMNIACPEVIKAFPVGAFNLHPGPLPKYAGLNAPSWAVYHQEENHAVTLHRMKETIDAGEIIYDAAFPITRSDTGLTVSTKCIQFGLSLIKRFLEDLEDRPVALNGRPQELARRNYYKRNQVPWDGRIQWNHSAAEIDAFVRASNYAPFTSPWGAPSTKLAEEKILITKTEVSDIPATASPGTVGERINGKRAVASKDQWVLIHRCEHEGRSESAEAILETGAVLH